MRPRQFFLALLLGAVTVGVTQAQHSAGLGAAEIIASYVEDYRSDRFAEDPITFGIDVPEQGQWTVSVTGNKVGEQWEVLLTDGPPEVPTFIYRIEPRTLEAIHEGTLNALTAQGKAFAGDYTPMSISMMEGYAPTGEEHARINPFSFHFWTRGFPEVIPFGEGLTRRAHGSNFVVFYYEQGLRTAWYRVLPEEQVRADPREQSMPFPTMIVAIEGTTEGEVDGKRVSLTKGQTLFIPPNVQHKWWNETDTPTEAILIMFGEGA
ncbi:MAG: cupin domain-containing protein [Bacteroidota bacterium]